MPGRYSILAIVFFWLTASGWMAYREFWPRSHDGAPPPVRIDLPDEAGRQVVWSVLKGDRRISRMLTWVKYSREDDTYELWCWFHPRTPEGGTLFNSPFLGMESHVRVTRDGELRAVEATITLVVRGEEVKAVLKGRVEGRTIQPTWEIVSTGLIHTPLRLQGPATELPERGTVLNPLQPVNALKDVHEGQTWEMPLFDPVEDALAAFLSGSKQGPRYVKAVVRRPDEPLAWSDEPVECLVIEYTGDEGDLCARTWVRAGDGKVLRHEATLHGERLVLERMRD